jgi:hypothetical protein
MDMNFNVEKCKVMHISRQNPQYDYFMKGKKFTITGEEKDVGCMSIKKNLKPSSQCHRAAVMATAILNQI